ncbi:MAG: hypothetical protein E6748_07765 [Clostridium perfringens]|nr:hypothetical protein [Clostridium perfringens]
MLGYQRNLTNQCHNSRNVNVLVFCIDRLKSFKEAIGAVYPFSKIQFIK